MAYSSGAISLFVSASVLLSLAALFLILRAVAIVISGRSFRWHDFFAYFGYVCLVSPNIYARNECNNLLTHDSSQMCTCAYTILMFYATIKGGLGQHVTDLTPTQLTISEKVGYRACALVHRRINTNSILSNSTSGRQSFAMHQAPAPTVSRCCCSSWRSSRQRPLSAGAGSP